MLDQGALSGIVPGVAQLCACAWHRDSPWRVRFGPHCLVAPMGSVVTGPSPPGNATVDVHPAELYVDTGPHLCPLTPRVYTESHGTPSGLLQPWHHCKCLLPRLLLANPVAPGLRLRLKPLLCSSSQGPDSDASASSIPSTFQIVTHFTIKPPLVLDGKLRLRVAGSLAHVLTASEQQAQAAQPRGHLLTTILHALVSRICPPSPLPPITSPRMGSGLLITAASVTAGCSVSAVSTSSGPIRYLERSPPFRGDWTRPLGQPPGLEPVRIKVQMTLPSPEPKLTRWS